MDSSFPTRLDNNPPRLEDDHDVLTGEALEFSSELLEEIQALVGVGSTRVTLGDQTVEWGSLAAIFLASCRVQTGHLIIGAAFNSTDGPSASRPRLAYSHVRFQEGKFTEPPFVYVQLYSDSTTYSGDYIQPNVVPDKITKRGFRASGDVETGFGGADYSWIAIQPPMGWITGTPEEEVDTPVWDTV